MYYHQIYSKDKDQPGGKAANPARGQLAAEEGKRIIFCPRLRLRIWSRETSSAVVPSRVSLLISMILRLNLVLTDGIPPEFRGGVHLLLVHIMYYECSSTYTAPLTTRVSTYI